jgi:hypothetical protein
MKKDKIHGLHFIIFFLFIVGLSLVFFHEYWRDETQSYLTVRNSHSLSELFFNSRYDGHPSLWFLFLYAIKFISPTIGMIKILHLVFAGITGWLILRFSTFSILQKILLIFGYFFFYEYAFIARNYAQGVLFIMLFCTFYPKRHESPLFIMLLAVFVVGAMLSNFYSFFIGLSLFGLLAYEFLFFRQPNTPVWPSIISLGIMASAMMLFIVDTRPPSDYGYAQSWNMQMDVGRIGAAFANLWKSFVPIPKLTIQFWNKSIFGDNILTALLGLFLLPVIVFLCARKKTARLFIVFIIGLIFTFSYFKFSGYIRHNGHMFIGFIAMLWMQPYMPGKEEKEIRFISTFLNCILVFQVIASVIAVYFDLNYPFSNSKKTADFIKQKFPNHVLVGHEDTNTSPICAFLSRDIYYPASDRFGSFIIFNRKRLETVVTDSVLLNRGDSVARVQNKQVLFILSSPVNNPSLKLEKIFSPSIEPNESYYLYTRSRNN